jgi:hypothetical protein
MRALLLLSFATAGCVAPKFLIDIPANSTPLRTARYYRTQDAANLSAGAAADELGRLLWHGPTDHYGVRLWFDSTGQERREMFRWRSGEASPLYRLGLVTVLGGIRRQTDKGYRESGWLFNVGSAILDEWAHMMVAAIRGHF